MKGQCRSVFLTAVFLLLSNGTLAALRAQATNVNAVGYVNTTAAPGLSLLSNPLLEVDSRVSAIFSRVADSLPNGTTLYLLRPTGWVTAQFDAPSRQWFPPDAADELLLPGDGFFLSNPGGSPLTITFAGEILQGLLTNTLPAGLSIQSSMIPQTGTLDALKFPAEPGDAVFLFDQQTQKYTSYFFDEFEARWVPRVPSVELGEAFYVWKLRATDWVRSFQVNQ